MHLIRRYAIMGGVILFLMALLFVFRNFTTRMTEVNLFRGAELAEEVFYPMMADSVNDQEIKLLIGGNTYSSLSMPLYMDEKLELMIPVDSLRDSFHCSARVYDENLLRLMKYNREADFPLDEEGYFLNDEFIDDTTGLVRSGGRLYVPVREVTESFGGEYRFDMETNTAEVTGNEEGVPFYPTKFSLYEQKCGPEVRKQGDQDTCWAFAAVSGLESTLKPEESIVFSANHMVQQNEFAAEPEDGGEYTMSMAYLLGYQGPVTEAQDPYGAESSEGISPVKHVQEIQIIDSKNLEGIKEAVFLYGGVQSSIYNDLRNKDSESPYYNRNTNSYCYIGTAKPNHDILIVGWDDDYPKENFPEELEGNGAFLCLNSWGKEFGDDGLFYISYYDTNIGIHNVVYTGIESINNYDHLYQTDQCGWVGQIGYGQETAYGANVYTTNGAEELSAIGFYATGHGTAYELFLVHDFQSVEDLQHMESVASGTLGNAGYYTIRLDKPVKLDENESYAVVVGVTTPGSDRPLAVEYQADRLTQDVNLSDGQGYISMNGRFWDDIENEHACNLCLKAYTKEMH